jgi:DNA topoisomerase-6 subunit A
MSSESDKDETLQSIRQVAEDLKKQIEKGEVPSVEIPTRTKTNIEYDDELDVWVLGDRHTTRSANKTRGAKKLLRSVYTIEFLSQQLEEDRSSTLRELYYLSESWDNEDAQFSTQDESNNIIEDMETVTKKRRESFNVRPEESGATIMGPLELREQTRRGDRVIHCQENVGEQGYQIPNDPDTIEFINSEAEFVLAVETGGMRDRLIENGFDVDYGALVVHLKGQPARATRRIIKRIHNEIGIPVGVFTDADPWSYRIHGSVSYGSIKSAYLSEYLATPEAQYIGIRPSDIEKYDLPTDPLKDSDINALQSELEDPRFQTDFWEKEIELQLEIEKKAEQQALASQGLDFVTSTYLPERLEEMDMI